MPGVANEHARGPDKPLVAAGAGLAILRTRYVRAVRDLCSPERLLRLAGARSFERGEEYALDGRVQRLALAEDSATATVMGAAPYRVTLRRDPAGALKGACTCPVGAFCKHCVAVGLAVAGERSPGRDELRVQGTAAAQRSEPRELERGEHDLVTLRELRQIDARREA